MALHSPLQFLHEQADAMFLRYGGEGEGQGAEVVSGFGEVEGEYAALRKGCALLDCPQRGTLRITGRDRLEFLGRMVTQELKGTTPWQVREAFWLNRKGRIEADLRLIETPESLWADVDVLAAAGAARSLQSFVFSEDVAIEDVSEAWHRLGLHGPTARALLLAVSEPVPGAPLLEIVSNGSATRVTMAGADVLIDHQQSAGEDGFGLLVERGRLMDVYERLLERGLEGHAGEPAGAFRLWPAGWHAFNIARIEAGTALYNVDFGGGNLPHETGVLQERVSFTKGCYLGQEIVARMQALGHPKQKLVALRTAAPTDEHGARQPVTGSAVRRAGVSHGEPIGAVTSSTRSPMLGGDVICFAQVKWDASTPGTALVVDTEFGPLEAVVQDSLRFWTRPPTRR